MANDKVGYNLNTAQTVNVGGRYENNLAPAEQYENLPGGSTTLGAQKRRFVSDRAGIVAATEKKIYQNYFDKYTMAMHSGMTFKIDRWYPVAGAKNYDMMPSFEVGSDRYGKRITKGMVDGTDSYSVTDPNTGTVSTVAAGVGVYMLNGALVDVTTNGSATRIGYNPSGGTDSPFFNPRDIDMVTNQIGMIDEDTGDANEVHVKKTTLQTELFEIGYVSKWSSRMEMFSEDMVHIKQKEAVGAKLGYAIDDLNQISMLSTTNRYFASSNAAPAIDTIGDDITATDGSQDGNASISYSDLKRIHNKLVVDGAEKINELITGSTKVGTVPVESKYHMIIHQNHLSSLEALVDEHNRPAFIPVHQYAAGLKAQGMSLAPGEVGRIYHFVVIVSERAMHESAKGALIPFGYNGELKWSTNAAGENRFDIYPILFPTKGSIAGVGLQGNMKPTFYYTGKETAAFDNLFRNKSAFAGKAWYASLITKPEGLLRYDVAATN